MVNYMICVLIGMTIGLWAIFAIKHIELVFISIACVILLRYLFGAIANA